MTPSNLPATGMSLNVVPARTGLTWAKQGLVTFFKQPLALGGLFFMLTASVSLLSLLPLGAVLALVLLPALNVGFLKATKLAAAGEFPKPAVLFSSFSKATVNRKQLFILGIQYLFLVMLIQLLVFSLGIGEDSFSKITPNSSDLQAQAKVMLSTEAQLSLAAIMALHIPLWISFWHAPYLVEAYSVPPAKAIFFSLVAFMRNFRAMAVYFLAWLAIFALLAACLGLLAWVVGSEPFVALLALPMTMLLASAFLCSTYFTICDCFLLPPAPRE